ncbi:Cyanovirin-N [Immersiella caudata]|uniref:Cyanovirin-N n=1 Tax=Immersiella caudata TaxID=314043 RepID=A0AA39XF05_9PEZI|nr:Cyanovirin-N [Immersiella caudata]
MFTRFWIPLVVLVAAVLPPVSASSGFRASCHTCNLYEDTRLQLRCKTRGGDWIESELDLNNCFVYDNGQLKSAGDVAGYHSSCFNCQYDLLSGEMYCLCAPDDLHFSDAEIDLNNYIGNNDGFAHCLDGKYGSALHSCGDFNRP